MILLGWGGRSGRIREGGRGCVLGGRRGGGGVLFCHGSLDEVRYRVIPFCFLASVLKMNEFSS